MKKIMKKLKETKRKVRAISPVLAILLMIVITVAASLVTYAWVMGYLDFTTAKAGRAMQIQSVAYDEGILTVYVQNVGEEFVTLSTDSSVYVDGTLQVATIDPLTLLEGETATIGITPIEIPEGNRVRVRVVDDSGTFTETNTYPIGGSATTPPPDVTRVLANDGAGFSSPAVGNLLVVVAGHRTDDPNANPEPTITGWTRQGVAYFKTAANNNDRRIVAIFTKIATGSETTVTVNWDGSASSVFTLYQEFTGATTYLKASSGVNHDGSRPTSSDIWASSPLLVPGSELSDPGGANILSIGAAVWRDDGNDISTVSFTGLTDGDVNDLSNTCDGASAFSYGSAVTQTSVSWSGDGTEMVSGLLIQLAAD